MSHREAIGAVAWTLAIVLLCCVLVGVLFFAGWGLVALYLFLIPASWLASVSIGLAVLAGLAYLASALYLAYRDIDIRVAIFMSPIVLLFEIVHRLLPKGIRSFLKE